MEIEPRPERTQKSRMVGVLTESLFCFHFTTHINDMVNYSRLLGYQDLYLLLGCIHCIRHFKLLCFPNGDEFVAFAGIIRTNKQLCWSADESACHANGS